jgi:hypothetical protein
VARGTEPLRAITRRLPHPVLSGLCYFADALAMGLAAIGRFVPVPMCGYLRNVYCRLAADKRRLVVYDQLNPAYAKYYSAAEARALLSDNGFDHVELYHRHGYSRTVVGERGLAKP